MALTLNDIILQVRRLVNDPVTVSGKSDSEYIEYLKDAASEVKIDYPDFTTYTISGTSITPTPTNTDAVLLSYKAACLTLRDDYIESVGDAILIRVGKISLDTSKSNRGFKDVVDSVCSRYNEIISNLLVHGVPDSGLSGGFRIDNYIEDLSSTKYSESLL